MKKRHAFLLAFLITLLIAGLFSLHTELTKPKRKTQIITRVIDGDTLELNDGTTIRLLNINAPEKNKHGYTAALTTLKKLENKTVEIETLNQEKYGRTLARIYTPSYLNLDLVHQGLAKKFLVNEQETKIFAQAETEAIQNNRGIWNRSRYTGCITTKIKEQKEEVSLTNRCNTLSLKNWRLEDESRKEYKFQDTPITTFTTLTLHTGNGTNTRDTLYWNQKQDIWNNNRDTLYLFDEANNIVAYYTYGY